MADDVDLGETIDTAAQGPAQVQTDAGMVLQQPLTQLIEADRYRKGQKALSGSQSAWGATRPARVVLPSALGD